MNDKKISPQVAKQFTLTFEKILAFVEKYNVIFNNIEQELNVIEQIPNNDKKYN